ncbi:NAD(P)/FAD-dependent oxidoreductase [Neisseria sp. Ec49-e6-T10]|uniref:NAD(P)/FAD-dependent oxidoreductase n=1 Tax=Neisseria sp. Ec49-e6-T10 TaxID=3140744 RepID=UPI003EBFB8B5
MNKKNIIIIGGGIAGMEVATSLSKQFQHTQTNIILIDKSPLHVWKPMLHMFAAGTAEPTEQGVSFVAHASIHGFQYHPGKVYKIDQLNKTVHLETLFNGEYIEILPDRTLHYDYLIVSTGSCSNDFGTKGVKEFAYTIDDLKRASHFFESFQSLILRAIDKQEVCNVCIVGAGATGVELAGELHNFIELASSYGDHDINQFLHITLIESNARILKSFTEKISKEAKYALEKLNIRVIENERVMEVQKDNVLLGNGEIIQATLTVWSAGVKAPEFIQTIEEIDLSASGQIVVNPYFQSLKDSSIFALGDCSSIQAAPLAPTAQVARQQALYLSRHFKKIIQQEPNIPSFQYKDNGALVSVGRYASFGVFGGKGILKGNTFKGYIAMFAHIMLYRMHQTAILGFWRAHAAWLAEKLTRFVKPKIRTY